MATKAAKPDSDEEKEPVATEEKTPKESAPKEAPSDDISKVAKEVNDGTWGEGADRKRRLRDAGYSVLKVQAEADRLANAKT